MKKYFKFALGYAIAALAMGVFFREFTKAKEFKGITALSYTHLHLFALGTLVFILLAILSNHLEFNKCKLFKVSMYTYNIGLILMIIMFTVRGIFQITRASVNEGVISGLAGVSHVVFAVGIITLLVSFILLAKDKKVNTKKQ